MGDLQKDCSCGVFGVICISLGREVQSIQIATAYVACRRRPSRAAQERGMMRRELAVHVSPATRMDQPRRVQGSSVVYGNIIYAGTCSRLTSGQPMEPMHQFVISRTISNLA